MSLSINNNTAAMAALQSLNQTTSDLTKTENTVSTGKSVNSASDNPAMYSIAQNMTAQISTLSGVSTGLAFSAQVLNTATTGLSSISSALQSLATNLGTNTTGVDNSTLNTAITQTLAAIDSAASGAKFQGVNLLSGATGSGTTYTSLSTAMDAQGSTFTQNGFNVTSAGLGLSNLSMEMSGSSLALGSSTTTGSLTTDGTTPSSQSVLQLKNEAAAGTGGTVSAANPSVTYNFVADSKSTTSGGTTTTDNSQTTALAMVGAAFSKAAGSDPTADPAVTASFTLGTDGKLTATKDSDVTIKSQTTASDGSTTYSLSNGDSLVQSKDGNGNSVYTANTAFDANGNATTQTVVTDVDMSSASSLSASGGSSSAQSVKQVDLMTQAMEYQGFGVSRDASNNLTVAGNSIDATSTQMGTFGQTPSIKLGTTPFSDTTTDGNPTSSITVGNNVFIAKNGADANDKAAMQTIQNLIGIHATDLALSDDGTLSATEGTATPGTGNDPWTLSAAVKNSDGSTTWNFLEGTNTVASITQSSDTQGNETYTYTPTGGTATVITNVNMVGSSSADQVTEMTNAMAAQGITASADSENNLSIISGKTVTMNSIDVANKTITADTDRTVGKTDTQSFNKTTTAGAITGASVVSAVVQAAISSVTRTASSIGYSSTTISNLQTTTSSLSDALTTGVGALTDADLAAASAKLTSLQTKQQLAVQALSIANSQSSTLLSLFRG